MVPAASGHAFSYSEAGKFDVFDNHVCAGDTASRSWATPLILPINTGTASVYQFTGGGSNAKSAAFSFRTNGSVYSWTGSWTSNGSVGTVSIPINGTVFVRSLLSHPLDDAKGCLYSFKVLY
jgi:hypothetical protein